MYTRITELIGVLGLKKVDFAKRLNLSQPFVSELCSGKSQPSDRTISDICREFSVNERWLRTGEGEMFIQLTPQEQLLDYVASIVQDQDAELQRTIISFMSSLPKELWAQVETKARELREQKKPDAE